MRARILAATRKKPADGSTHWNCRKLAAHLGVSKDAVHRVWKEAGLKPHRIERYLASDDPDFESKAADNIGLYLNPPQHAAVFCVDEKTAIQALDRLDPVLPLSPGRAERHGFATVPCRYMRRWIRNPAKCSARPPPGSYQPGVCGVPHRGGRRAPAREVHIILDNLSAHKSQVVCDFLATHLNVHFHFAPTYWS